MMRNNNKRPFDSWCICRTVFLLSEALDEQLKTLWFSPFQTDEIESDLEMVCAHLGFLFLKVCNLPVNQGANIQIYYVNSALCIDDFHFLINV